MKPCASFARARPVRESLFHPSARLGARRSRHSHGAREWPEAWPATSYCAPSSAAIEIYVAMLARGYDGEVRSLPLRRLNSSAWMTLAGGLILLASMLLLGALF